MPTSGLPLGVVDDLEISAYTVPIRQDMVVALYTDGMTEYARDAVAGENKLRDVVSMLVGNVSIEKPAKLVFDLALGSKQLSDDAALLLLQFSSNEAMARPNVFARTKHWRFHASDARAAHVMRVEVGDYLRGLCGDHEDAYACEVIVGELLANTVEHAPGHVHMMVEWDETHPVLVVRDSGPGWNKQDASLPDPMSEGSRGLFLVEALSVGMTIGRSPEGGTELRVPLPAIGHWSDLT